MNDVITVRNDKRYEILVTQIEPFVRTEFYMDYEKRIHELEKAVAELKGRRSAA